ncbi:MAG: ATP-binding cassette domain-containing protein [Planctomycetota bacterium]
MACIELDNVTKRFGAHTAVDGLDLAVPDGAIYGFIGPNGSGKTTTIRMILNIIEPDAGRLSVLGEADPRAANDRVGYLPEERGLYKKMPLARQMAYFGQLKGMERDAAARAAGEWLDRLGLGDWAGKKIEALSKGMAQKAQFIAAVIAAPKLLILDEPFSGLDPVNLEVIRQAILDLRAQGTTVIFSTHDMAMAEKMCDALFMIFRGKKVLDGTLEAIQAEHAVDTVRLDTDAPVDRLPGVSAVTPDGRFQLLHLGPGADAQRVLAEAASRGDVRHFEIVRPSLHDIFLRIAGPEAATAAMTGEEAQPEADHV